jgi:hypothetical protein
MLFNVFILFDQIYGTFRMNVKILLCWKDTPEQSWNCISILMEGTVQYTSIRKSTEKLEIFSCVSIHKCFFLVYCWTYSHFVSFYWRFLLYFPAPYSRRRQTRPFVVGIMRPVVESRNWKGISPLWTRVARPDVAIRWSSVAQTTAPLRHVSGIRNKCL